MEDESSEYDSEEEDVSGQQRWKLGMAERAAEAFYRRQESGQSLRKIVYGRGIHSIVRDCSFCEKHEHCFSCCQ